MWVFGSNKVKIWPLTSAVQVNFLNFQKKHIFAYNKCQEATFSHFWSKSESHGCIHGAKMWIFGSNAVKIRPLTAAVEVNFAYFQKMHFFAFHKGQKATFCQFWSESGLSNYIYEAKMWVFGSKRVKIWPLTSAVEVNFVNFQKNHIFAFNKCQEATFSHFWSKSESYDCIYRAKM